MESLVRFLKIFRKDILIYMFSQVVSKAPFFLILPLFTYYLSPGHFGTYDLFVRYVSISSLILMLGLPTYILIDYIGKDKKYIDNLIKNMHSIYFYFIVIYSFIFLLLGIYFYGRFPLFLILVVYFCSILTYFAEFCVNYLRISSKIKLLSLFLILGAIMNLSVCLIGLIILKWGYRALILGFLTNQILYLGYYCYYIKKKSLISISWRPDFSILKKSLFFVPNSLLNWILFSLSSWLLLYYYSVTEVGLYALAFKFGLFYNITIAQPLNVVFMPYLFRRINDYGVQEIKKHFFPIFLLLISISMVLLFIPTSFYNYLSVVIRNDAYFESFRYIKYIISSFIILHAITLISMIFMYYKKIGKITQYFFLGALFNIVFSLILIPRYSIYGAVIALLMSCLFIFIVSLALSKHFITSREIKK